MHKINIMKQSEVDTEKLKLQNEKQIKENSRKLKKIEEGRIIYRKSQKLR